jgi:ferric-dicitrate binding protein FerR (iron transport regulator)
MPYKDPERKRQWEQEHREQRNAVRRTQRFDAGSGQPSVPKATSDIAAALHTQVRKRAPDPVSDQESQGTWITALLGLAVAIGVVLLAVFAGVSGFNVRHFGTRGSGNPRGASAESSLLCENG